MGLKQVQSSNHPTSLQIHREICMHLQWICAHMCPLLAYFVCACLHVRSDNLAKLLIQVSKFEIVPSKCNVYKCLVRELFVDCIHLRKLVSSTKQCCTAALICTNLHVSVMFNSMGECGTSNRLQNDYSATRSS